MPRKKSADTTAPNLSLVNSSGVNVSGANSNGNQEVAHGNSVSPSMRAGRNGGRLLAGGKPGNKGGPGGHNSLARQTRIASLADTFLNAAPAVVNDPTHKDFAKVGTWAVEMKEGKPKQAVEGDLTAKVTIQVIQGLGINPGES